VIAPLASITSVLSPLKNVIHDVLYAIQSHTGLSWAWSIIVLTVLVRIALVPLTIKQMRSMQAMQRLAPEMKALQEKYKSDRTELNKRMMEFYKENNVNPLGSCLPLVLQLPVFFALYLVLRDFASNPPGGDLSFMFGTIPDITAKTSTQGIAGLVLIVLYVVSQLGSTLLMPTTGDPRQRYLFMAMPFIFVLFVINFPVGLMLYWITSNLWTVGQQAVIRRTMPPVTPAGAAAASGGARRSSRTPPKPAEDEPPPPAPAAQPTREAKSAQPPKSPSPKPPPSSKPRRSGSRQSAAPRRRRKG